MAFNNQPKQEEIELGENMEDEVLIKGSDVQRRGWADGVLFARAAKSWWNPKYDTPILEAPYQQEHFSQSRRRMQISMVYLLVTALAWICVLALNKNSIMAGKSIPFHDSEPMYLIYGCIMMIVIYSSVCVLSVTRIYERGRVYISITVSLITFVLLIVPYALVKQNSTVLGKQNPLAGSKPDREDINILLVATFSRAMQFIVLLYSLIQLPLYLSFLIGMVFSLVYEFVHCYVHNINIGAVFFARILLHCCIHIYGLHIFFIWEARNRSTFLQVAQSLLAQKDLEQEKILKKRMINSLMPPKVADEVMKSREEKDELSKNESSNKMNLAKPRDSDKVKLLFRSFHMSQMDHTSILFADIVGFTKMSSNKTAEHLVNLLNDLFGRFDIICARTGCEKISTLGDCYYCVAGCPEPRSDHAKCAIELGLGMCIAIQEFDGDHNEQVNMRVGVHTGTVLCGLVGTRRFKFDVWSNDVTLANIMESEGKPGEVHVSENTYKYVEDLYDVSLGEPVEDIRFAKTLIEDYNTKTQLYQVRHIQETAKIKTFFIVSRKEPLRVELEACGLNASYIVIEQGPPKELEALVPKKQKTNKPGPAGTTYEKDGVDDESEQAGLVSQLQRKDRLKKTMSNDQQLAKLIADSENMQQLLHKPPINRLTLNFRDPLVERCFREHYGNDKSPLTLSAPRVAALQDVIVCFLFTFLISLSCYLTFIHKKKADLNSSNSTTSTTANNTIGDVENILLGVGSLSALILSIAVFYLAIDVCCGIYGRAACHSFTQWVPRHVVGLVIVCLPSIVVLSIFDVQTIKDEQFIYVMFGTLTLAHFGSFTMLSSILKSVTAILSAAVFCVLMIARTGEAKLQFRALLVSQAVVDCLVALFFVLFLNREFEIAYRLSFYGDYQAATNQQKMLNEKEQADWLLHNIIPAHVIDILRKTTKYCKNHKDVGVIFAKVVNFDEFYDESFEGGREYLRVLNELMGDLEDLFDDPKYKDVEKIKTIGSCLMAASGLNPLTRSQNKDPNAHLYSLMEFSLDLLCKLEQFNIEIFNFNFNMSIGFNYGEVTAGVIGTTKLLYDIWGDTVNISSRMYSTGVEQRVQVTELTMKKLKEKFDFEYRATIPVKGKGDMKTYLVKGKKPGATWS